MDTLGLCYRPAMNESTPTDERVLALVATAAALGAMGAMATYKVAPVDIPWHLATGRWVLELSLIHI